MKKIVILLMLVFVFIFYNIHNNTKVGIFFQKNYLSLSCKMNISYDSCFKLGVMYYEGKYIPEDIDTAKKLFRKAADDGNVDALIYLARISMKDEEENNYERAKILLEEAFKKGNYKALVDLVQLYMKNQGEKGSAVVSGLLDELSNLYSPELLDNLSKDLSNFSIRMKRYTEPLLPLINKYINKDDRDNKLLLKEDDGKKNNIPNNVIKKQINNNKDDKDLNINYDDIIKDVENNLKQYYQEQQKINKK